MLIRLRKPSGGAARWLALPFASFSLAFLWAGQVVCAAAAQSTAPSSESVGTPTAAVPFMSAVPLLSELFTSVQEPSAATAPTASGSVPILGGVPTLAARFAATDGAGGNAPLASARLSPDGGAAFWCKRRGWQAVWLRRCG